MVNTLQSRFGEFFSSSWSNFHLRRGCISLSRLSNTSSTPSYLKFLKLRFILLRKFLIYAYPSCKIDMYYFEGKIMPLLIRQGRLKIWTEVSHWFLLTLKPLEILKQNFQHFNNLRRYEFWPNLKDVAQKLDLPRPFEVFYIFGGKSKFWAPMTLIFCTKRVFIEVDNW